jgi:hypothetical protein
MRIVRGFRENRVCRRQCSSNRPREGGGGASAEGGRIRRPEKDTHAHPGIIRAEQRDAPFVLNYWRLVARRVQRGFTECGKEALRKRVTAEEERAVESVTRKHVPEEGNGGDVAGEQALEGVRVG